MAIRTTSSGSWTIRLPFRLNITRMVNSRAISVIGLILRDELLVVPLLALAA